MGKTEEYRNLIKKARDYYDSSSPEIRNLWTGDTVFDLEWCPRLEEEINFWAYWHGRGNLDTTEVLLVGQDFGSYKKGNDISPMLSDCLEMEKEEATERYVEEIRADKQNKTDQNLIQLFKVLGNGYHADSYNDKLFFTNLCLGYRSREKISGGDIYSQMKHDSIYLKELINMLEPKVVICLGKDTYISALTGLSKENQYLGDIKRIRNNFYESLEKGENHITIKKSGKCFEIFALSHTGHYGVINRNRFALKRREIKEDEDLKSDKLKYMKADWEKVKEYL